MSAEPLTDEETMSHRRARALETQQGEREGGRASVAPPLDNRDRHPIRAGVVRHDNLLGEEG